MKTERWTFFGKVLPERVPISWGTPMEGEAEIDGAYSFKCKFRISLHLSQLVIDTTFTAEDLDIPTMRNFAAEEAQRLVGLVGYKVGGMFDVEIISATKQDTDEWVVFGNEWSCLKRENKNEPLSSAVVKVLLEDHSCNLVLSDFQRALREDTGFYCYRAIEVMMQAQKSENLKEAEAWQMLRINLNVDRSLIDRVKHFADPVRHGKSKGMSGQEREEIIMATDQIIGRFLDFVLGGRQKLDPKEYNLLSHT